MSLMSQKQQRLKREIFVLFGFFNKINTAESAYRVFGQYPDSIHFNILGLSAMHQNMFAVNLKIVVCYAVPSQKESHLKCLHLKSTRPNIPFQYKFFM